VFAGKIVAEPKPNVGRAVSSTKRFDVDVGGVELQGDFEYRLV
jgi:hypothetical protein